MKKHRKLLSLLLAGLVVFGSAGCSGIKKNDSDSSSAAGSDSGNDSNSSQDENGDKKDEEDIKTKEIRAQDDFYGYVNRDTLVETEIPYGDPSTGVFEGIYKTVQEELNDVVRKIVSGGKNYAPGSNEQIISGLYDQLLGYKDDGTAFAEVKKEYERLNNAGDINELFEIWGDISYKYGTSSVFNMAVETDLKNPDRNCCYLYQSPVFLNTSYKDISDDTEKATSAKTIARDMLIAVGEDFKSADEKAWDMAYLGINIANGTDIGQNDPVKAIISCDAVSSAELKEIMSNLDGSVLKMFFGIDDSTDKNIYILDKGQLEAVNEQITEENLEKWKTYAEASFISGMVSFIADGVDELEGYNKEDLSLSEEERTITSIQNFIPQIIGEEYVKAYYTPGMKKELGRMFDELIKSYTQLINGADWLSPGGRASLLRKLNNIKLIDGGGNPHETDPADAKLIGKDAFQSYLNIVNKNNETMIRKLSEKVSREDASMTPQTVNAMYQPNNTIVITVGIMHAPMFDVKADHATNLGGLGSVVGHEIGHAFDSTLMAFDENGRYNPSWLSEADRAVLSQRADALTEYYSKFTILEVFHVDGELTNGENYADLGGMECITNILDDKEELRKLFENYATIWRSLEVDADAVENLTLDVHSPGKTRVNAVLSSCEKFYDVYDVKEGDGMYIAPEERVSRW